MTRYTVTFQHIPGHGTQDHLYDDFIWVLSQTLKPRYLRKRNLKWAINHNTPEARQRSGFDGNFLYRIEEISR